MKIPFQTKESSAILYIEKTDYTKESLLTSNLKLRERQLLLMLDSDNAVCRHATVELVKKVNLEKLARQGWIVYTLSNQNEDTIEVVNLPTEIYIDDEFSHLEWDSTCPHTCCDGSISISDMLANSTNPCPIFAEINYLEDLKIEHTLMEMAS